jgi:hypothetical protein
MLAAMSMTVRTSNSTQPPYGVPRAPFAGAS